MAFRLSKLACLGVAAAFLGLGATAASAQGDGRFNQRYTTLSPQCTPGGFCGPSGNVVRRDYGPRPVIRERGFRRPVVRDRYYGGRYRGDRPFRHTYRPYRPRYDYDYYDNRPDVYIDLAVPSYRYVEPVYPRYRQVNLTEAHIEWCYNRYRTYREWDNSYVPRRGVRAQCYSPYS